MGKRNIYGIFDTMKFRCLFIPLFLIFSSLGFSQDIEIIHLKTDNQTTPLGFDNPVPEFSWILQSSERGTLQTAFEIQVGDDQKKTDLGNCWKSGKIESRKTFGIKYSGRPLVIGRKSEYFGTEHKL